MASSGTGPRVETRPPASRPNGSPKATPSTVKRLKRLFWPAIEMAPPLVGSRFTSGSRAARLRMSRLTFDTPAMSRAVSTVAAPVPMVMALRLRAAVTVIVLPAEASITSTRCGTPAVRPSSVSVAGS